LAEISTARAETHDLLDAIRMLLHSSPLFCGRHDN
jgi:hypothetical protein